jgi:midasin
MNPATDVGKVNLPETLRHKFVSIFTDETSTESDISLILDQRQLNFQFHKVFYQFYEKAKEMSRTVLTDGAGRRVLFSLRAFTRAILYMNKAEPYFGGRRACFDALALSFVSPLSPASAEKLLSVLNSLVPVSGTRQITIPEQHGVIQVEDFFVQKGPISPKKRPDFILTTTAKRHLQLLAQAVFLKSSPVLLQGPTSSGKTSMIEYLADITGHEFVRINNHEHTDISEYIGGYSTSESGRFEFVYGPLVRALRNGAWVVLDELNLAPSDVLEALNRLLDQNNELFIAETQETIKPAASFMLFATQNPPGLYGGRKQLSRAFRGRFVEIHIDEIPAEELATILIERCGTGPSFAKAMIDSFCELRRRRQFSAVFAGKHAFLTVRDLLRWAMRGPDDWKSVAQEGFSLLGERLRNECSSIKFSPRTVSLRRTSCSSRHPSR